MSDITEKLLRERIAKLERTMHYYDRALNTPQLDRDRKRLSALELALIDVLHSDGQNDPAAVLAKCGLSAARAAEVLILLTEKNHQGI
ncbi:hypothetical protein POK33_38125 [Burkholderia cenocepacia]|uniref:hypothetical protein n=1 Tax=Burkholderia cenocepacia TaxID=95486 RepID=UPI0023B8AFBB|nr:hypothetical protein [Burkholderia cenocepacia]MDF0506573.1 hypothetical protein [Burkholderia cenocepacia]